MKRLGLLLLLTYIGVISAKAQSSKFISVYTRFTADCKAESKVEADEVPFICKAVGDFRVRINPASAWAETIEIIDKEGNSVITVATVGYGYTTDPKRVLEWRLANGKPFAVIFRVNIYNAEKAEETGDNPYQTKYKTGEKLLVRGWQKYSYIDYEVDAKEKDANLKAQKKADEGF